LNRPSHYEKTAILEISDESPDAGAIFSFKRCVRVRSEEMVIDVVDNRGVTSITVELKARFKEFDVAKMATASLTRDGLADHVNRVCT
jgi:hypothetical protein